MIVVTGATGGLGSRVVEHLLRLVPAAEVAASVRDPGAASSLAARGVDVRRGDYDRPDTLLRAFARADRLLLVSASGIDYEKRVARHTNAIEAARRAGVGHVFYTSLLPGDDSVAHVMRAHIETERLLRASGLAFTVLKNGVYAEATASYLGDTSGGEVAVPADGPVAWVSRDDLAEGAARLLRAGGRAGESLRLTGPAALTLTEYARALSAVTGRPLVVRTTPLEEYIARETRAGRPEAIAREWATTYFAVARGEFASVDPFLGRLLGRPLKTVGQALERAVRETAAS